LPLIHQVNAAETDQVNVEDEIKALKKDVQDLRKEVETLKAKSTAAPVQPPQELQEVTVSIDDDPLKGKADAPITIIEFSDYQCPFCERLYKATVVQLKKDYIDTGKVKLYYRDFPLTQIHFGALKAAEAARCAGDQGKYWEFHNLVFENQSSIFIESN